MSMRHQEIEKLMQKHLDRETSVDEDKVLAAHVKSCPGCREKFEKLTLLGVELTRLTEFFPDAGFNDRVLRAVGLRRSRAFRWVAAGVGAAWTVVVAAISLSPLRHTILKESVPLASDIMRFLSGAGRVLETLGQVFAPLARLSPSGVSLLAAAAFTIISIMAYSKIFGRRPHVSYPDFDLRPECHGARSGR